MGMAVRREARYGLALAVRALCRRRMNAHRAGLNRMYTVGVLPEIAGTTARTLKSKDVLAACCANTTHEWQPPEADERRGISRAHRQNSINTKSVMYPRSRRAKPQKRPAVHGPLGLFPYREAHKRRGHSLGGRCEPPRKKNTVEPRNTGVRVDRMKRKSNVNFDGGEADPAGLYGGFECIYHGLIEL